MKTRLCVVSWTSFMPSRWKTVNYIREHYDVELLVIAPPRARISKVYEPSGYLSPLTVDLESIPAHVELIPLKSESDPTRGFRDQELRKCMLDFDPDVIWIHGEPLQPLTKHICWWFWFRRRPRIYQAAIDNVQTLGSRWRRPINRILLSRIAGFLATAAPTADALVNKMRIPREKVHVTYLPNVSVKSARRIKHWTERDSFRVGFAGRLVARKGIMVLLEAFEEIPPGIELHVAGDGDEKILTEINRNHRVRYWGLLNDLSEFLTSIDVLVVPSLSTEFWTEQFGRVIAEAFSVGVPVIGSSSGSIPDVVGDGGLIYEENSSMHLRKAILELNCRRGLYKTLSSRARRRYRERFSISAHAKCLAPILELRRVEEQTGT